MDWIAENKNHIQHKGHSVQSIQSNDKSSLDTLYTQPPAHIEKKHSTVHVYSMADDTAIRTWLAFIGEHDDELINEVINQCRSDHNALKYFLCRAKEMPYQQ